MTRRSSARALPTLLLLAAACSTPAPTFEEVAPAEELYAEALEVLAGGRMLWFWPRTDFDRAIEMFQSVIDNYPYSDYAVLSELKIADAYFEDARYDEALSYYRDFADLHPQHERVPYTLLQSALCHERQMHPANRDQTATRDALVYLDRLLAKYPHTEQAREAEVLWRDLRTRLANNVNEIGNFYLKRDEYESAAERFRSLLNEYPGLGLDAEALYKLGVCYSEMNRGEEAQRIFQSIVQNYQESEFAEDAEDRIADAN